MKNEKKSKPNKLDSCGFFHVLVQIICSADGKIHGKISFVLKS
jgi:hypothetical protein